MNLTRDQLSVLRVMPGRSAVIAITHRRLKERVSISPYHLYRLTSQLEEMGLITRERKKGSRFLWMQLTSEGEGELNARDCFWYNSKTGKITKGLPQDQR